CDAEVVRAITAAGPDAVSWLTEQGTQWDRNDDGSLRLGLEGAHGRRRIVHAHGDGTGAELLRTVVDRARVLDSISLWDHSPALRILTEPDDSAAGRHVVGVLVGTPDGPVELRSRAVILATGGVGGLYTHTTNPLSSRGQGLALAFRAGATLRDLEMVQFHPTALAVDLDPMPLVSEAVRGEGAILVNENGEWILKNPLAARDVVSRAEWAALQAGHKVFLDARQEPGDRFAELFPAINAIAQRVGLNPATDLLPVRPAAHYHMGGVLVDTQGQSSVPGLFAAGEVASTGLHGANRLASNSLLEAVVCGRGVAQHLKGVYSAQNTLPDVPGRGWADEKWHPAEPVIARIRGIVSQGAGVLRDAEGLTEALEGLRPYLDDDTGLVGYLVAWSALQRLESRGGHTRTDHPLTAAEPAHTLVSFADLEARSAA
ncbi:MAG: FAD-binding protein, partial [Micropruina sp.]